MVIYVLQHDNYEGIGILHRAYFDKSRAEQDMELVQLHDSGRWQLIAVQVVGEAVRLVEREKDSNV